MLLPSRRKSLWKCKFYNYIYVLHNDKNIMIEPVHDKTNKMTCAQRRIRSACASPQSDQSSLSAWKNLDALASRWAHSEDSWGLPESSLGAHVILLVLSCCGSIIVILKIDFNPPFPIVYEKTLSLHKNLVIFVSNKSKLTRMSTYICWWLWIFFIPGSHIDGLTMAWSGACSIPHKVTMVRQY